MPENQETIALARRHYAPAEVRADTFNAEDRTVEVIWTTEAPVRRYSYSMGGEFLEVLVVKDGAVRMERFEAGMSVLDTHDNWSMDQRIGTVVPGSVSFKGGKAYATIKFSRKAKAEDLFQDLVDGHTFPVSVGYKIHQYEKIEEENSLPIMRATDWEPMEISAVPVPADSGAHSRSEGGETEHYQCIVVRSDEPAADAVNTQEEETMPRENQAASDNNGQRTQENTNTQANDVARAAEVARAAVEQAATEQAAERARAAEQARSEAEAQQRAAQEREAEIAAARQDERTRLTGISETGRTHGMTDEFIAQHQRDGTSIADFRNAVLDVLATEDEGTRTGTNVDTRGCQDETDTRRSAVETALMARYDPANHTVTPEARQYMGLDLLSLAREVLRDSGESVRGLSSHALAERALHGTGDFPIILGNVANTVLRAAYEAYPNTFQAFCRRTSATNFKAIHSAQLSEAPALEKVSENGEFKRGTLTEGKESYKLETFGKVIGITRQALINDELGAFTRIPAAFGVQAAILEGDIVWGLLTDNVVMSDGNALFHSSHSNLGSALILSADNLSAGRHAMRLQKGSDGRTNLNLRPQFLMVPSALESKAEKILTATPSDDETKNVPGSLKSLVPIVEPRLDAVSSTAWMLAASPSTIDTIEYAYLSGEEGIYTEQRNGFDVDGIEIKVRMDFGAGAIDYKGFYKNPGAAPE